MSRAQWRLVGAGTVVVAVVAAVLLAIVLTRDSKKTTPTMNHVAFARLWTATAIGSPKGTVLSRWPTPDDVYPDGFKNQCYQWFDRPFSLYNLCFKKGVLVTKNLG